MGKQLRVTIIDDDPIQIELIANFVNKTNFLILDGSFTDPLIGLESIVNSRPDVLFIDIEMPELTGFELLKTLSNPPQTIVVSGKPKYAVEAFELNVVDYLVKPIESYPRFLKAVNKIKDTNVASLKFDDNESIFVKENSLLIKLALKDVMYFEAYGDYVKVGTRNKIHVIHSTLSNIEDKLNEQFVRVHRSYIVRLDAIANIDHSNLQIGEKIIPVSKTMKNALMDRIKFL